MKKLSIALIMLSTFLGISTHTYACRCKGMSVEEGVKYSAVVFKGKVLSVVKTYDYEEVDLTLDFNYLDSLGEAPMYYVPLYYVALEVERVYKGIAVQNTVYIITPISGSTCGFLHFKKGLNFIVYAYKGFIFDKMFDQPLIHLNESQYWTNHCTRTYFWSKDEEDEILKIIEKSQTI